MGKRIQRILQILLTLLLVGILVCNLYTIVQRSKGIAQPTVFGFSGAVVLSGSMQPSIPLDAYIVTKAQKTYAKGDVISFEAGNHTTTHRIVQVLPEGFQTKGDANGESADKEIVKKEKVVGKVVLVIPKIGRVFEFFSTPLGICLLVLVAFGILYIPTLVKKKT